MAEVRNITWEGRGVRLSYTPRWSNVIDHVEIKSHDGDPLSMTETGYRSHFFGPVDPVLTMDEIEAMVRDWLNTEAAKPAWQDYVLRSQQLSLF